MVSPVSQRLRNILKEQVDTQNPQTNPGLLLHRYLFYDRIPDEISQEKESVYKLVKAAMQSPSCRQGLQKYRKRWIGLLAHYGKPPFCAQSSDIPCLWRLVVGLGGESILETGFTTHRIHGFPMIPGSAIKGMTRHFVERLYKSLQQSLPGEFLQIFGKSDSGGAAEGRVVFFDAMPAGKVVLETDVMTPHCGDYYQKGRIPGDWLEPKPIRFLACGAMKFRFAVAGRAADRFLVDTAWSWLRQALEDEGIGAKTAAGYGRF